MLLLLLLSRDCLSSSSNIAQLAEDIEKFPRVINSYRDIGKHYDVLEAYDILKRIESLPAHYKFSEELPFSLGAFTEQGKSNLAMAVSNIQSASGSVALYTCEPYTVLLGSRRGSVFVIDTHAVPPSAGGKNSGMVKFFKDTGNLSAAQTACSWLW